MGIELAVIAGLSVAAVMMRWARRDYLDWVGLGPGGLPHTAAGWLIMCLYRLIGRNGRNTARLHQLDASADNIGYLHDLPDRGRPRPQLARHPVPQRQVSDCITADGLVALNAMFDAALHNNRDVVDYRRSHFEKHSEAITLLHPECGHVHALMSHGEIAHIHPSDGSMHMVLSPRDAAQAIDRNWGELHGLAGFAGRVPVSYTFVYAPNQPREFAAVAQMLDAAIAHMCRREPAGAAKPARA